MATTPLTPDVRDLLTIFNSHGVSDLLAGGYAVIGRDDLLVNQAASGRPQGLAEIDAPRRVVAAEQF